MRTLYLLSFSSLLLLCACRGGGKSSSIPPLEVEVAIVQRDSLRDKITFSTTVEPLYEAIVEPRVSGYLQSIKYNDGEFVPKGATIFTINPIEYQTALLASKADYAKAEAALALARSNYQRSLPLVAIDAISRMEAEQYLSTYQAAYSSLNYAAQQVTADSLNLSYTTIQSPISGVIAATAAKEGDYVGVGSSFTTLTTIKYLDTVIFSLPIAQSRYLEYRHMDSSDNSTLLSNVEVVLSNGDLYPYGASYYYTKQSGGDNTSTVIIVARVANPDNLLKSGMFTRVRANIGKALPKVVIPQQAVTQSQGVSSVWVVGADSLVEQRGVSLGSTYGDMWSVVSGVDVGEMVLLTGQLKVGDGSRVIPKKVR